MYFYHTPQVAFGQLSRKHKQIINQVIYIKVNSRYTFTSLRYSWFTWLSAMNDISYYNHAPRHIDLDRRLILQSHLTFMPSEKIFNTTSINDISNPIDLGVLMQSFSFWCFTAKHTFLYLLRGFYNNSLRNKRYEPSMIVFQIWLIKYVV